MWNRYLFLRLALACLCGSFLNSCKKEVEPEALQEDSATLTTIANSAVAALSPKAQLGKLIFFDNNLSESGTSDVLVQSCASCHQPNLGFTGFGDIPLGGIPRGFNSGFAEGAIAGKFGNRKPPSAAYASFSPVFSYTKSNGENGFKGGLFWDGRATGARLGSPAAEQALGPLLSPVEQNHATPKDVLLKIQANAAYYGTLWELAWGTALSITDNTSTEEIQMNYDRVGLSIAAFEATSEVNKFSSKFDRYLKGQAALTSRELKGFNLFTGKAKCDKCHSSERIGSTPPLFTDFKFHNIGVPKNRSLAAPALVDLGLGGFLQTLDPSSPWYKRAGENMGKFKTPTLRNVAKGVNNKRYMHNGVFKTLEEVVHFYSTRDVVGAGWDAPEVRINLSDRLGDLGLKAEEEAALVAFLKTLSDE